MFGDVADSIEHRPGPEKARAGGNQYQSDESEPAKLGQPSHVFVQTLLAAYTLARLFQTLALRA